MKELRLNLNLLLPYVVPLQEIYANEISENAKGACDWFLKH